MRRYQETEVLATTKTELIETKCDLCGKVAKFGHWMSGSYDVNETELEVTISHREGTSYPESGWGTEVRIDICPECFRDKLVPWVNENGVHKIEIKEWDW